MKKSKTLVFKYQHGGMDKDAAIVSAALEENGFPFVCYNNVNYYLIKVQRATGKTWADIMHIINSVHSAAFRYESTIISNGAEYVDC